MNDYEAILGSRTAKIKLIERNLNMLKISIDGKIVEIDAVTTGNGVYSIITQGHSYDIDVVQGNSNRKFTVNLDMNEYQVEIVDAESRYNKALGLSLNMDESKTIFSPMPGKIVKILVAPGDNVVVGQTLIIVSAMKMESEFNAKTDSQVKAILVSEGDTVDGGQILINLG